MCVPPRKFGPLLRRHHCRYCGFVGCRDCCNTKIEINRRVCAEKIEEWGSPRATRCVACVWPARCPLMGGACQLGGAVACTSRGARSVCRPPACLCAALRARGESLLRVPWVAVPNATRARRVNRRMRVCRSCVLHAPQDMLARRVLRGAAAVASFLAAVFD
jgi:hypothetical protein